MSDYLIRDAEGKVLEDLSQFFSDSGKKMTAVDWNTTEDPIDAQVWNRATNNDWKEGKIDISADALSAATMEKPSLLATMRVFMGLTLLDSIQSRVGVAILKRFVKTDQERDVLNQFEYMETMHTKSYSKAFSTCLTSHEIHALYRWCDQYEVLNRKKDIILKAYATNCPLKARIASVYLESFAFFSSFYMPLYCEAKLGVLLRFVTIIKLIIR